MTDSTAKRILGWREWIDLPELGIQDIKVKVDTGARSSALHAFDVEFERGEPNDRVTFSVHPTQRNLEHVVHTSALVKEYRAVTSSTGHRSVRPVIETMMRLHGETIPLELTLVSRDEMGFRMLLGREAIRGQFLVDPGRSYVAGRRRKRRRQDTERSDG